MKTREAAPKPLLLLLPLLVLLLFGNCRQLEKLLTQRTAYELLGGDLQPDQLTRLRAALQLAHQQRQQAQQRYAHQPAALRAELKRIEAGTQAQTTDFLTPAQRRLLHRHRAKIERRLGITPAAFGPH